MTSSDLPPPDDPALSGDALRRLEERLDRASEAAERLMAEAAARARAFQGDGAQRDKPPPAGWQAPGSENQSGAAGSSELELLTQVIQSVRDLIPPDLQRRLAEALRELLMALRALIDFYLERLERQKAAPGEVQDIPIT
jgi:hypothetical protein